MQHPPVNNPGGETGFVSVTRVSTSPYKYMQHYCNSTQSALKGKNPQNIKTIRKKLNTIRKRSLWLMVENN